MLPMQQVTSLTVISGSTPPHLKSVKRRFMALNGERLVRVRDSLKPHQRAFVDLLPLLFHINHPELPGFVSKKVPAGLADFNPSKRALDATAKLTRKFNYRRRAMRTYNIHALYMIGSSGTIAYSDNSDFDIWVCRHPDLSDTQVDALREKCAQIRVWARSLGLDAQFFVMDPAEFRRGETGALSDDSSGSAQHHLLLEEFYRTGLLLAGRYPAWWLVPPEREAQYREHLDDLVEKEWVHEHEYVDFGDITRVPAEEFFGAALWQLHKAVDSPYKSVLKLLLMEAYSGEYPKTDLLCTRFKKAVYEGESNVDNLDPYVLMSNKVQEYLLQRGEHERLELARRCFYFKVNEKLSEKGPKGPGHKHEMMAELTQQWQWGHDQVLILDSRASWKIHRVLEERRVLVDELTRSYRIVSEFARRHARSSNINSTDLNLLGRRLHAAFERKAGKVEIINPGISTDLVEEHLSFVQINENGIEGWLLYRGEYDPAAARKVTTLKRAHSLIELIAWCHFNQVIGPQTLITLHNRNGSFSSRELLAVIDSFRRLFPGGSQPKTDMDQLRQPARILSGALYINLGVDPLSSHTRQGIHLTSNRSDALCYGGFWKNLALSFDLLLVTSWREVLTFRYTGDAALLNCLCDYLAWAPLTPAIPPPAMPVYSFSTARGMAIAHRVEELFRDAVQAFYGQPWGRSTRYVLRIERDYYLLQPENDMPRYQRMATEQALTAALGRAQDEFSPVIFDRYAIDETPLARLVEQNRPDTVQVFYFVRETTADVYVLDERGSLFYQAAEYHSSTALVGQYQRFLESAIGRCNVTEHSPDGVNISSQIEFFRIRKNRVGQTSVERQKEKKIAQAENKDYFSIQVIGDPLAPDQRVFSLYCEGREFSALEYGENVFSEVARYVLAHRKRDQRYPIYITDADVSRSLLGADGASTLQTVHFLNYKKEIEQKLNTALHAL